MLCFSLLKDYRSLTEDNLLPFTKLSLLGVASTCMFLARVSLGSGTHANISPVLNNCLVGKRFLERD